MASIKSTSCLLPTPATGTPTVDETLNQDPVKSSQAENPSDQLRFQHVLALVPVFTQKNELRVTDP